MHIHSGLLLIHIRSGKSPVRRALAFIAIRGSLATSEPRRLDHMIHTHVLQAAARSVRSPLDSLISTVRSANAKRGGVAYAAQEGGGFVVDL